MSRIDSGFSDSHSFVLKEDSRTTHSVHNNPTRPTRRPKSQKTPTHSHESTAAFPTVMDTHWPDPEKRVASRRKHTEPRRPSIASSSDRSTAKSRGRGYSYASKPSSRRTSCTLVDPSRPVRHHRLNSSSTARSTTSKDIDDVLALHFRSCTLFQAPTHQSPRTSPCLSGYKTDAVDADFSSTRAKPILAPAPRSHADLINIATTADPKRNEEVVATIEITNTVTHWTSPSTRRREYERMDKENSGLRGLARKIIPRCVSGPPPLKFYEKDTSDTGSVRRYRMDVSEAIDEDDQIFDHEKDLLRVHPCKFERKNPLDKKTKKSWGCF